MHYFYQENEVKLARAPVKYHQIDATKLWARHYSNSKYLTFFVQNEIGFHERNQAAKELDIADKKMSYWKRHPNFNTGEAARLAMEIDKTWKDKV